MRPLIGIPCHSNLRRPGHLSRFCVLQTYCRALQATGAAPVLVPLLGDDEAMIDICRRLDGLFLAGGGDIAPRHYGQVRSARLVSVDPPQDRVELLLTRFAMNSDQPILGICRGIQVLNVAQGGTLYQDIPTDIQPALRHDFRPEHPPEYLGHDVTVQSGTLLSSIVGPGRLPVNSFHHQAVADVAPGLIAAAVAPDGVIEGLEAPEKRFVLAVQWHPEHLMEDDMRMRRILEAFVRAAA